MIASAAHFLLFSEARCRDGGVTDANQYGAKVLTDRRPRGEWRFVLEAVDGSSVLDVVDDEVAFDDERLELIAVVRGLEALDQPSRVTLVTASQYVSRGLRFGISEWRENNWHWERFGRMVPVKNRELWQRIDRALQFHQVECRTWRFDQPEPAIRKSPQEIGWRTTAQSHATFPAIANQVKQFARQIFRFVQQMWHRKSKQESAIHHRRRRFSFSIE